MGSSGKIDIYCERVDPSFWAEPLNAITNLAFIIAALIAWRAAAGRRNALTTVLILILVAIGIGSFLFHTVAESWAGAADTIPILLFILVYIYAATYRFFGAPLWAAIAAPFIFIGFAIGFAMAWGALLPSLNGSQGYFPVIIILIGYGLALRAHPASGGLLLAAGLFALSLTFRTIDYAVCDVLPMGTHFLWHVLNGTLLGIVLITFIRHGARRVQGRLAQDRAGG
ncbi:MAG: ceramidase domain-containing protein [Pseudomonadota bacterium]